MNNEEMKTQEERDDKEEGQFNEDVPQVRWKPFAFVVGGVLILAVIVATVLSLSKSEPSPNQLAQVYVEGNIDRLGEDIAGFVVQDNWLLTEVGGEWVEDRVNEVVKWSYSDAQQVDDGIYLVVADARVIFTIDYAILSKTYNVDANLPFNILVDTKSGAVAAQPDYFNGRLGHDIPATPQLGYIDSSGNNNQNSEQNSHSSQSENHGKNGKLTTNLAQEYITSNKKALGTNIPANP